MRAPVTTLCLAVSLLASGGCLPDKRATPEWQKPPASYDPVGAALTFNAKGIEAFNSMSVSEREAFIKDMAAKPGTFKGQGIYKAGNELGESMDNAKFGKFEIVVENPEPVLYEITTNYLLFAKDAVHKTLPPNGHVEFSGTLANVDYQDSSKPRKMEIKVVIDSISALK